MKVVVSVLVVSVAIAVAMPAEKPETQAKVEFPTTEILRENLQAVTTVAPEDKTPAKTEKPPEDKKTDIETTTPPEEERKVKEMKTVPVPSKPEEKDKGKATTGKEEPKTEVGADKLLSKKEDEDEEDDEEDGPSEEEDDDDEDDDDEDSDPNLSEEEKKTSGKEKINSPTWSEEEEKRCDQLIGKYVNGTFVGLEVKHDIAKILEKYGGSPGKVNATWTEKGDAPVIDEDSEKRPLPDADEKYWIYKYEDCGASTFIRTEHAVRRFSGSPKAFLEIRGQVYFYPEDFCGKARKAYYTVDDRGFTFTVSREFCKIDKKAVTCSWPKDCTADPNGENSCTTAKPTHPLSSLIAVLVGGGR